MNPGPIQYNRFEKKGVDQLYSSEFQQDNQICFRNSSTNDISLLFRTVHTKYPDKFLLPTEACNINNNKVLLGDWESGVKYSSDIIENLNNWAVGWVDWNLCLDEQGEGGSYSNFSKIHSQLVTTFPCILLYYLIAPPLYFFFCFIFS